jgi:N-acetyl-alpha-D-glucosaminyl L-malate synthase BshA
MNSSNAVTAVSKNLREQTLDYFEMTQDIKVINNFVDIKRFQYSDKEHFKKIIAPNGEKILAHVSNFRKVKRVQDAIQAFSKIREKVPAKMLMIGDGPERPAMEQLCRELGTCNDISFLGKQEKMEELLSIADLFLLPSEYESFGLAALEAMACKVPVISSNAGGIPEININGKTGFLSDVGDVDSMATNSLKLLLDDKKMEEFKANAIDQANAFAIENIVPQYEKLYEQVLEEAKVAV